MISLYESEMEEVPGHYPYKQLMIIFLILKYMWEQYINWRQLLCSLKKQQPQNNHYMSPQHLFAQSYSFDSISYDMLALSIKMGVECLCIMANLWPFIWKNVNVVFPMVDMASEFQRAVGYVLIEAFINKVFFVPLSAYKTFAIDKKYNLTNKGFDLFVYDLFVDGVLYVIIIPPIIYGYLRVVQFGGSHFYLFLQIFALMITILLTWIHPNLIAPLFNSFKEMNDPQLRFHIHNLTDRTRFPLQTIVRMNGSVRSQHSNAYFYGFGKYKRIVLYDTLIEKLSSKEIVSVIAHELGHWDYNHPFKTLVVYLIEVFFLFYMFSFFVRNDGVFISFGFTEKSTFIGTALFFQLFEPLTSIFDVFLLILTRKFQFQADLYACQKGYGGQLQNALVKLYQQNTFNIQTDYLYAWLKNSHPSTHERIGRINMHLNEGMRKKE